MAWSRFLRILLSVQNVTIILYLISNSIVVSQLQEANRKLYQSELRAETLVNGIDELKMQHESERERYDDI